MQSDRDESEDKLMMWGYGFSWGGMLLMMLSSVIWVVLLAVVAWAIIRWVNGKMTNATPFSTSTPTRGPGMPAGGLSSIEILRQRYARGEIDAATFEQMRERLESSAARSYQQGDADQPIMSGS
jgi:putative membrane protein